MSSCIYRGVDTGRKHDTETLYACHLFGDCALNEGGNQHATCARCSSKLAPDDPRLGAAWQDILQLHDRTGARTHALRGMLAGRSVFLACGGPSANELSLGELNQRGCWTMAVNNMAAHHRFRPQAFVCGDPPMKFSDAIWLDPGIMKFVPTPKLLCRGRGVIIRKREDGAFERVVIDGEEISVRHCPNVWAYCRRKWLVPDDTFFNDVGASVGNYDEGVKRTGQPKTVCHMMTAMRLLRYLGARRVFLIGVDFAMRPDAGYAFAQGRTVEASVSNNNQYAIAGQWLCTLQSAGVFRRFGIEFFNCNPTSGLRAFPYVSFDVALDLVIDDVPQKPDLSGWYEKEWWPG